MAKESQSIKSQSTAQQSWREIARDKRYERRQYRELRTLRAAL
jgi:hypothetical protein